MSIPSKQQQIYDLLEQCKKHDNDSPVEYWQLSDLAILYSDTFSIKNLIKQPTIDKMNSYIKKQINFTPIIKDPVHIQTVTQSYNHTLLDPASNTYEIKQDGIINQNLTRVACEYIFHKAQGKEFEQAYFLYPNKGYTELKKECQALHLERLRQKTDDLINTISMLIFKAANPQSAPLSEIWNSVWCKMFAVRNYSYLCATCGISKNKSPIDYMSPKLLQHLNNKLQQVILDFAQQKHQLTETNIKQALLDMAIKTYAEYRYWGKDLQDEIVQNKISEQIETVRRRRQNFWEMNFLHRSFK